jgi:hypothetical protein
MALPGAQVNASLVEHPDGTLHVEITQRWFLLGSWTAPSLIVRCSHQHPTVATAQRCCIEALCQGLTELLRRPRPNVA